MILAFFCFKKGKSILFCPFLFFICIQCLLTFLYPSLRDTEASTNRSEEPEEHSAGEMCLAYRVTLLVQSHISDYRSSVSGAVLRDALDHLKCSLKLLFFSLVIPYPKKKGKQGRPGLRYPFISDI